MPSLMLTSCGDCWSFPEDAGHQSVRSMQSPSLTWSPGGGRLRPFNQFLDAAQEHGVLSMHPSRAVSYQLSTGFGSI